MTPLIIDFESYWADDYTLKDLTPVEYVLDPRFEAIGCSFKEGLDGQAHWVEGPDLQAYFDQAPRDVWMISHNMLFDGCVAAWRYGFYPKMYGDTLSLSRAVLAPWLKGFSLDRVAGYLRLGGKPHGVLAAAKNRRFADIRADTSYYMAYVAYGLNDCDLSALIFKELARRIPAEELVVIDMLMRMALQPRFDLDQTVLTEHLNETIARKEKLLADAGFVDRAPLMSNNRLADILRSYGIEPPTKISNATGKVTFAFAKTDEDFRALAEHPDPMVQALVAARLGVKSTIEETRARRFLSISNLSWPNNLRLRPMPMPLRYGAAHTHRFGGDWDLNVQNLGRGGKLRKALRAPPGHKVVRADASQIECRITGWLAGEKLLLDAFERGEDVYSDFGTVVFGMPVSKDTPVERTLAKSGVLGCGFHMGWEKFQRSVNQARLPDGKGGVIQIDAAMAMRIVTAFRSRYWRIPMLWRMLQDVAIPCLAGCGVARMMVGPIVLEPGRAILPALTGEIGQGLPLTYRDLKLDGYGEWTFAWADRRKKLYSGKLLENFVQSLDRVIVIGAALRLQKLLFPYGLTHQAHDENIYIVPDQYAEAVADLVQTEMARRPPWAPDLPLAAEKKIALAYG